MPRMDIQDAGPETQNKWVVIVKDGKSTYWYHLLDNGEAHVLKSEDALTPTYIIKDCICSCPAAFHSKLCKHIKTVTHLAVG